jgi:ATP-dependent DNA helicase RecQ
MCEPPRPLLDRCVAVDLEVDPKTSRIFAFAAVWQDDRSAIVSQRNLLDEALDHLEAVLPQADHLIGHNILRHDLPHLVAARPRLASLATRPIDTLWLNPLAFPRNPYHHLVKHYQDGRLQGGHVNDPQEDARLVFQVLEDQLATFRQLDQSTPDALTAFHYLTTRDERSGGFGAVFAAVRGRLTPTADEARLAVRNLLTGRACNGGQETLLDTLSSPRSGWATAYALSWISVAGGDSVMPPWVRRQFPEAARTVRSLRDVSCSSAWCSWCREKNDPVRALSRWFGFEAYRAKPTDETGRPLQERIVAEAMRGQSLLGILPTGTGKSVCYQIPALTKFEKTGALSVVICQTASNFDP